MVNARRRCANSHGVLAACVQEVAHDLPGVVDPVASVSCRGRNIERDNCAPGGAQKAVIRADGAGCVPEPAHNLPGGVDPVGLVSAGPGTSIVVNVPDDVRKNPCALSRASQNLPTICPAGVIPWAKVV